MKNFVCGTASLPVALANFTHTIFVIVKIIVPIMLIFLGTFDMVKAMIQSDEKDIEKTKKIFVNRIISAVLVFFVVMITQFAISLVARNDYTSIVNCINCLTNGVGNGKCDIIEGVNPSAPNFVASRKNIKLKIPDNDQYKAEVRLNGQSINLDNVIWESENPSVATVENGVIKATGIGKTTILVYYEEYSATIEVTVEGEPPDEPVIIPEGTKRLSHSKYDGINYYLYVPNDVLEKKVENISLILYLHSYAGVRPSYEKVMNDYLPKSIKDGKEYPAIIIMPHLKSGKWHDIADKLIKLTDYIASKYNINKNKISITGVSLGGNGAIDVGTKHGSYFSCIVLIGANRFIYPSPNLNIPVWGIGDTGGGSTETSGITGPATKVLIENIKKNGKVAKFTLFKVEHGAVGKRAYQDCKVIEWMVQQDKRHPVKSIDHKCPVTKYILKGA